jgi:hypothetical protein
VNLSSRVCGEPAGDSNKHVVRRWLDQLGGDRADQPRAVPVICHDPAGTRLLATQADERVLRQELEPQMAGPVERSYSLLSENDLVAVLGMGNQRDGRRSSHWVQLCRVRDGQVEETWVSGSARDVDWGPLPDEPLVRAGTEDTNKRTVQRWWDEMYSERRFEELMFELAGPEYIRHEATGSWTTTIQQHLQRVQGLYSPGQTHQPLRISYGLVADGDRVAGWGTMRGYRGGETSADGVNSFVQMFRVANGRLVETWFAGWAIGVDWTT